VSASGEPSSSPAPHQIAYAVVLLLLITGAALRYVVKPAPLTGLNQLMFSACACMFLVMCEQTAPCDPRKFDRWFEERRRA
jgi:hypothetical protein